MVSISRQISLPTRREPLDMSYVDPKVVLNFEKKFAFQARGTNPERQVARATKLYTVGREYVT